MLPAGFLVLLAYTSSGADLPTDAAKGTSLYRGCQAEVRLMHPDAVAAAAQGDLVSGSYCIGYLTGFLANLSPTAVPICTDNQPMSVLVRAYVAYMDRNPQYLEQDKRVGVRLALQDAFPCPAPASVPGPTAGLHRDRL